MDETDETLSVTGSATGLTVDSATMTITDDDTAGVTVTPTGLTVTEGSSDSYTVRLNSQPTGNVTVTVGGESGDVSVDDTTLTFTTTTWSNPQSVTVRAGEDNDAETDPQVTLTHTVSGGGYSGVTASDVTVDITENDTASTKVTLSVDPTSVSEGAGSTTVTVTGTLNGGVSTSVTSVTVSVDSGTATAVTDFDTVNGFTLTIPANQIEGTQTFALVPTDDAFAEGAETVTVSGSANGLTVDSATLTITDDDTPVWSVSVDPSTIAEADTGSSTVTVSTGGVTFAAAKTVTLDFTGSTATETSDYTVGSKTLTLDAGSTSVTTTVAAVNDTDEDPNEQVKVAATVDGATVGSQQTVTITDDDTPAWSVSVDPSTIAEADAGTSTVTVSTGGVTFAAAKTVTLDFADSTATETSDYTVGSKTLTLDAGSTSVTTTVTAVNDTDEDPNEQVKVAAEMDGATVGAQQTITITDDDTPVWSVSVDPSTIAEADTGSSTVTVSTGGVIFAAAKTVTLDFADSTATETSDYTVGSKTLTLGAGSSSVTTTVTAVDDMAVDPNEQVKVAAEMDGATVGAQQTITITDDDAPGWSVSVDPSTIAEADAGSVCADAGSTSTGAVDPLDAIADYCATQGIWLHVDGAYGGCAAVTEPGARLLRGIERADSIGIDPHKWFFQPYETGCLLVKDVRTLERAFSIHHDVLQDSVWGANHPNQADHGLQLSRRDRAFKIWMSVQIFGMAAFRAAVTKGIELAERAARYVEDSPVLELLTPASLGIVCFRVNPDAGAGGEELLHRINRNVLARVFWEERAFMSSTSLRGRFALRLCVINHSTTWQDVRETLETIERFGREAL